MSARFIIVIAAVAALALGCSKSEPSKSEPSKAESAKPKAAPVDVHDHATADVVAGSHEDWCGEHAVPESQCSRCNPDLVAAFKATGDWCDEHGLPESQCLKCNPDLVIKRPPPSEPAGHAK
jgi:endonuclease I